MPTMANITVKANDGITDVVYTAMNPASGDGVKALWRSTPAGASTPASQPWLAVWSRNNGSGTARRVDYEYYYPHFSTNTTTGLVTVANRLVMTGSFLVPNGAPSWTGLEASAQSTNLLSSPLLKSCLAIGFAPT